METEPTLELHLNPPESVLKEVMALTEIELSVLLDMKLDAYVDYLEALALGWKTFGKESVQHRRALLIMLSLDSKQALHEYEEKFIYPKMSQLLSGKPVRNLGCVDETYSRVDFSNGSGSIIFSGSESDYDEQEYESENAGDGIDEEVGLGIGVETADIPSGTDQTTSSNDNKGIEEEEDQQEVVMDQIAKAQKQIENALAQIHIAQKTTVDNFMNQMEQSGQMEQSVQMEQAVQKDEKIVNFANLSASQRKRAKKAQRKAKQQEQKKQEAIVEEQKRITEARLLAEAVSFLEKEQTNRAVEAELRAHEKMVANEEPKRETFEESMQNLQLPIPAEELARYMEILETGRTDFPEGSAEHNILQKVEDNRVELTESLLKNLTTEAANNQHVLKQIIEITRQNERDFGAENPGATKEDMAKQFLTESLKKWKNLTDRSDSKHYVELYTHLLNNASSPLLRQIADIFPFQHAVGFDFEKTLLVRFKTGKLDCGNF